VLLVPAVKKRCGERVEAALFCQARCRVQSQRIAVKTAIGFAKSCLPEKGLRIIVSPEDNRQVLALREGSKSVEPFFEFLIRLNVRIVKKSVYGQVLAAQDRNRVDRTGTAADMEKNSRHLVQSLFIVAQSRSGLRPVFADGHAQDLRPVCR